MSTIEVRGVRKSYGQVTALRDVNLTVHQGEVTVIIGPSGSGKSTLLRALNHLEKVDAGTIRIDGELIGYRQRGSVLYELPERAILRQRSQVGFVFQNFNLFPHLTVLENVIEAPLAARRAPRAELEAEATRLLERVGVADKAAQYPRRLSGDSSSGWPLPALWRCVPRLFCLTSPPRRSTPNWSPRYWTSSRSSRATAPPW